MILDGETKEKYIELYNELLEKGRAVGICKDTSGTTLALMGYSEYDVVNNTVLITEPSTTQDGVIVDIDQINRFCKTQVFITYKFMKIEDYREFVQYIDAVNVKQFKMEYFDIDTAKVVEKMFYLAPEAKKTLYWKGGVAKGVVSFSLEFISTNASVDDFNSGLIGSIPEFE
jgi:hypothetical protein